MSNDKLQDLYDSFLQFVDTQAIEHSALEIAAIMMAQALTIYKSALSEEEYNMIVDNISSSRDKIHKFERPVIQ